MDLASFLNRHAGETAWLFGKGPSLSTFDFSTAGALRCAINDVAQHVPDCLYCFSNDGVERWRDVYCAGQVLFQPERCLGEYNSLAPDAVECDVCAYPDDHDDRRLAWTREQLAEHGLTVRRGTLGSALQILHIMGITTIHLVGIDGGQAHAPGYEWRTRLRADHWKDYDAIRHAAIDAGEIMGITLKFHNQDNTMENDGKVFIRMTRNCFAEGTPYSLGEIVKVNPRVARDLIATSSAEWYEAPQPAKVETATAPIESAETTTAPTHPAKKAARRNRKN